jgi:CHAD domain-containing protein
MMKFPKDRMIMNFNLVRAPMAKSNIKWIEGLEPDAPVSRAAKKTLRRRLRAGWEAMEEATEAGCDDPEPVHQLRVATRRGMAAMQGYAELLPRKKAAWIEKQLKRIRRCAGEARDFDVLAERLRDRPDAGRLQPLIERLEDERRRARRPIMKTYRKLARRDFRRRSKRMIGKIRRPKHGQEATYAAWARVGMQRSVDAFFTAAAADLNDIAALHQMRIEGKLLRYALEYFGGAIGPEVREHLYPQIEQIQSLLGLINDHASAMAHYENWRAAWNDEAFSPLLEELTNGEKNALRDARQEFFRWWTTQRAAELKQQFVNLLQLPGQDVA